MTPARSSNISNRPGTPLGARLNLLLSYGGWRDRSWADLLPCILEPLGITSIRVRSGNEATRIIADRRIHIAIVDLRLPLDEADRSSSDDLVASSKGTQGGTRILQLLRRSEAPPPTVVVRNPTDMTSVYQRTLHEALREGAFAVLDDPVKLELVLETMRRILKRHYANTWPNNN